MNAGVSALVRLATVAAPLALAACDFPALTPPVARPGALDAPFAVSNFFTPSGYMGDGEKLGNLEVDVLSAACKERPPAAVGDCYRFTYHPQDKRWVGVYWVYPANNWGSRAGRNIAGQKFKEVRLKAASATPDLLVKFLVGGINDSSLPHSDRVAGLDVVRLGTEWKTIRIDISGQEFDRVIGALAWALAYPEDWDGKDPVVLFIDDIVWDTESTAEPFANP